MSDEHGEYEGLIDDDPALDYIMYRKMTREERPGPSRNNSGCLVVFLAPSFSIGLYVLVDLLL